MDPELDLVVPPPLDLLLVPPPPDHEAPLVSAGSVPAPSTFGAGPFGNGDLLLPAASYSGNCLKIGGAEVDLSMMEPLESFVQSVGSTTAIALQDNAESNLKGMTWSGAADCDSYSTPKRSRVDVRA